MALMPITAQAANEIAACGVPDDVRVETPDFTYCNIYDRQLAYKETRDTLKEELLARQKAFAEPGKRAYEQYRENLQKVYEREAKEAAGSNP